MCYVEEVINDINRESISKLIIEREEKQRQKRESIPQKHIAQPEPEPIDILSKVVSDTR